VAVPLLIPVDEDELVCYRTFVAMLETDFTLPEPSKVMDPELVVSLLRKLTSPVPVTDHVYVRLHL
jgi:hypothetical protein